MHCLDAIAVRRSTASGYGLGAKRDSFPRSGGGVWGVRRSTASGCGLGARRDSFPRSGGGVWGVRRSTPQKRIRTARAGPPRRWARRGRAG
jgi:hypothetical protein